jgi:membrane associated rhomboid family serine protease
MAWEDRDYNRQEPRGFAFRRFDGMTVVAWLLVINFVIFVLDAILSGSSRASVLSPTAWGNFNIWDGIYGLQVWRWVTYQFLHADLLHIAFNMLALFFFGPLMEQWWGPRRFVAFYLLCGVSGAVVFAVLSFIPGLLPHDPHSTFLIGASGSVFGILVGCAVLFPRKRVQLIFPPVPMSMRTMALVFLGIAALSLLVGARNAGGEAAHLGGAGLGFLLVTFPASLGWVERLRLPRRDRAAKWEAKQLRRQAEETREQAEVDRILDKVRQHGIHSLTRREKSTLQRATERQRKA